MIGAAFCPEVVAVGDFSAHAKTNTLWSNRFAARTAHTLLWTCASGHAGPAPSIARRFVRGIWPTFDLLVLINEVEAAAA